MCDLMHLRKLSMTRRFVLSLERKAHMIQLAISDSQVLNPTENILTVGRLTEELRQNAVEDQKIFYKVARAVHRGVSGRVCNMAEVMSSSQTKVLCNIRNIAWQVTACRYFCTTSGSSM